MAGLTGSDLVSRAGFRTVADPYTGQSWVAIPAIAPDWAIVHVHEADRLGNGRVRGPLYDDHYLARAARHLLLTAERLVDTAVFAAEPERTDFPAFLTDAVAVVPRGAWPTACPFEYPLDEQFLIDYLAAAKDDAAYARLVAERILPTTAGAKVCEALAETTR